VFFVKAIIINFRNSNHFLYWCSYLLILFCSGWIGHRLSSLQISVLIASAAGLEVQELFVGIDQRYQYFVF
jgi:hypothetical protein